MENNVRQADNTVPPEPAARQRSKEDNHTKRLLIDRLPREPIEFKDGRSVTLLWGRELNAAGKVIGFQRVKLWNRAGLALMSIMRRQGISESNPITVDLTGFMRPDYKNPQKLILDAQVFSIVGQPVIDRSDAKAGSAGPDQETGNPTASDNTGRTAPTDNSQGAKAEIDPGNVRPSHKLAEVEAVVTAILDTENGPAEISALRMKEWSDPDLDRDDEKYMFRAILPGEPAQADALIRTAANWHGYYIDLENPVKVRLQGEWLKVDPKAPDADRFLPHLFKAAQIEIVSAPNLASGTVSSRDTASADNKPTPAQDRTTSASRAKKPASITDDIGI